MGWSRRGALRAGVLGAAAFGCPVPSVLAQEESARVRVAIAHRAWPMNLPVVLADQLGYFKQEGLELDWLDLPNQSGVTQALLSGGRPSNPQAASAAADLAVVPLHQVIQLQSGGLAARSVVLQGRSPQWVLALASRATLGTRGLRGLRSLRIGVTEIGSTGYALAKAVLLRAGLEADTLEFKAIPSAEGVVSALRSGEVDALCLVDPWITQLEQRGEVRVLADTRGLRGTMGAIGASLPGGCLMVKESYLRSQPAVCQSLVNGVVRSLKWLKTAGPSDLIRTVPEAFLGGDRALYLAAFAKLREALSTDGLVDADGLRAAINFAANADSAVLADRLVAERAYTNELVLRAKVLFSA